MISDSGYRTGLRLWTRLSWPVSKCFCGGQKHTGVCPCLVQCRLDLLDKLCAGWARNSTENLVSTALLSIYPQLEKEKQNKTKQNLNKRAEN